MYPCEPSSALVGGWAEIEKEELLAFLQPRGQGCDLRRRRRWRRLRRSRPFAGRMNGISLRHLSLAFHILVCFTLHAPCGRVPCVCAAAGGG